MGMIKAMLDNHAFTALTARMVKKEVKRLAEVVSKTELSPMLFRSSLQYRSRTAVSNDRLPTVVSDDHTNERAYSNISDKPAFECLS